MSNPIQLTWVALPVISAVPAAESQMFDNEDWRGEFNDNYPVLTAEFPDSTVRAWGLNLTGDDPDSITAILGEELGGLFTLYIVCSGPKSPGDFAAWRHFPSYQSLWDFAQDLTTGLHHCELIPANGWETNGVTFPQ